LRPCCWRWPISIIIQNYRRTSFTIIFPEFTLYKWFVLKQIFSNVISVVATVTGPSISHMGFNS
jgi:hypothetical protein